VRTHRVSRTGPSLGSVLPPASTGLGLAAAEEGTPSSPDDRSPSNESKQQRAPRSGHAA
jgi:hypothetical protein